MRHEEHPAPVLAWNSTSNRSHLQTCCFKRTHSVHSWLFPGPETQTLLSVTLHESQRPVPSPNDSNSEWAILFPTVCQWPHQVPVCPSVFSHYERGKCASFQSHHIYRTTKSMPRASSPSGQPHSLPWITSFQQFQDSLSPCSFHIVPFTLFLCLNSLPFHAQNRFFIRSKRTKAFFSSTQGTKGTSTIDSFSFQEASIST